MDPEEKWNKHKSTPLNDVMEAKRIIEEQTGQNFLVGHYYEEGGFKILKISDREMVGLSTFFSLQGFFSFLSTYGFNHKKSIITHSSEADRCFYFKQEIQAKKGEENGNSS